MAYIKILIFLLHSVLCFNINTNHFIVYVDPQNATYPTYFGYTVMIYPGDNRGNGKWVNIGAPRGKDPNNKNKIIGVVYNCPILEICKPIAVKGYTDRSETLDDYWIGGSMDISYKHERLAICGFRAKYKSKTRHLLLGACYLSYFNSTFKEITPLDNPDKVLYRATFFYGEGEAGFSTHFPTDENAIILGAPGVLNWAGTIIKVDDVLVEPPVANKWKTRSKRDINQISYVADVIHSPVNDKYDLFGYSVSSGYFYAHKKLYYVASTPKSFNYKGKVVVADFSGNKPLVDKTHVVGTQFGEYFGATTGSGDLNADGFDDLLVGAPFHTENTYNEGAVYIFLGRRERRQLKKHAPLYGQKTNGQFGSAIMFLGDINNDGYGDLAVGAPYEEEFSGVLYIYRGNSDGVELQPCQKIIGKNISPEIRGFGISISRPADIDNNNYNDIAVGAHLSGNAVLLMTSPIVVVNYDMTSDPKELQQDTKHFELNVCYWFTHYAGESIKINRTITVDGTLQRADFSLGRCINSSTITVNSRKKSCENIKIFLKNITNFESPIAVSLSYNLTNSQDEKKVIHILGTYKREADTSFAIFPILDEYRSIQTRTLEVPFSLDCGRDKICQSQLDIEVKFENLGDNNVFVVGSMDSVRLTTTIKNSGEHAYSTQLEVRLLDTVHFRQIPPACNELNSSAIICQVDNPLRRNSQKMLDFNLDMNKVNKNNYKSEIGIIIRVITSSMNNGTKEKLVTLTLKREADIVITGKSGQQSVPIEISSKNGMPIFTQTYWVEKLGASPLEKVEVTIAIPHTVQTSKENKTFIKVYPPEGTFAGQPVDCTSSLQYITRETLKFSSVLQSENLLRHTRQVEVFQEATVKKENIVIEGKEYDLVPNRTYYLNCSGEGILCSTVMCTVGPFEKRQTMAVIQIKMMFDPTEISGLIEEKDIVLYSTHGTAKIQIPPHFNQTGFRNDAVDVSVLFVNEKVKKKVALWIIILSTIAGFLLLILIIYGLTKVGFFKRTKREELKNLKAATQQMIEQETAAEILDPVMSASTEGLVDDDKKE